MDHFFLINVEKVTRNNIKCHPNIIKIVTYHLVLALVFDNTYIITYWFFQYYRIQVPFNNYLLP